MRRQTFFTASALAAAILAGSAAQAQLTNATTSPTLNGDPAEWGAITVGVNSGGVVSSGSVGSQYQFNDPIGDNTGNGFYTVPTNENFGDGIFDIDAVRVAFDFNNLYIAVTMAGDTPFFGAFGTRVAVWLDRDDITSDLSHSFNGYTNFCQNPSIRFPESFNWDYHLSNRSGFHGAYFYTSNSQSADFPGPLMKAENTDFHTVEFAVPWTAIGGYPTGPLNWQMAVGVGSEENSNWRLVNEVGGEFSIGGGCANNGECFTLQNSPALFDMIGAPSQAAQEADLTAIDCGASPAVPPIAVNSIVSFAMDPVQAIGVSGGSLFWDNDLVRIQFSQPATGPDALDPSNYTVSGATPDNITVTDIGQGGGFTYVKLSRAITQADIDNGVQLNVSGIEGDGGAPIADGASVEISGLLNIIPVTVDASDDPQTFLAAPRIIGSWDGFSFLWRLSDGTDPWPEIPGDQTEPGDIPGDGIYHGRVFTTASTGDRFYAIISEYDFGDLVAPGRSPIRRLSAGYWGRSFDRLNNGEPINVTKPFLSTRLAEDVTVTLNLRVPTFFGDFTAEQAANDVEMFVQAGGTFGTDNALPTLPSSDMIGEADVTDGLLMTYVNTAGGFHNFTATTSFAAGVPDVGSFRFGYRLDGGVVREEEGETAGQQANAGQNPGETKATTIHFHLARIASDDGSRALGRTLDFEFRTLSLDIPPPPSDGVTTNVADWMILD